MEANNNYMLQSWRVKITPVPFAVLYMNQDVKLNYLYAALCLVGAVYFIFRG